MAKIKLFVLLAAFAAGGTFLAKVYLDAESPSSVKVTVYKVELMTGRLDTQPLVVFSNTAGKEIDLAKDIVAITAQVRIPAGTYKRIRMTVTNGAKLSIATVAGNPCGNGIFTDRVFPLAKGMDSNAQAQIDFATYDDDGGTWADSRITHFLLKPVTVSENQNAQVKFRFNTTYNLFCVNGTVEIRAPWSVWAETL